jgi:hypothetical protein
MGSDTQEKRTKTSLVCWTADYATSAKGTAAIAMR